MQQPIKPFGYFLPNKKTLRIIELCRRLPANWLGKQVAQILRKQVIKREALPLDLCLDNIKLRCHLNDNISERNYVFMPWRFDKIEIENMLNILPSDGVFIDIGANIGIYSAIVINHLNSHGKVIAIEASPQAFSRLDFNISATLSDRKNPPTVNALMCGISNCNGKFKLFLDSNNLGASSLLKKENEEYIEIQCVTLADVIQSQQLTRIDVIKCDIEGAEDKALVHFLQNSPEYLLPKCIIFENNQNKWQDDLLNKLRERNYRQIHKTRMNFIYQLYKSQIPI